jgi:geranylgeranyl diphosphate synthase, type I
MLQNTTAARSPVDVADLRQRVNTTLEEFLLSRQEMLATIATDTGPLFEAIAALVRGGKRLRSAFCYWGWRAAGAPDSPGIVRAAAAVELFQASALIHDDVMDASDTRRGMPAAHRRFAALHRDSMWQGDPDQFGRAGAILAGDLCLVWSAELFHDCGLDPGAVARGRGPFDRMRAELMAGQYLDVLEQARAAEDPAEALERARRVIRYKSAKYSVQEPLLIGGALADAGPRILDGYAELGLLVGEAFQLRDDVLGVFGDPAVTGKPAGDDLREGKRTVLVAQTRALASPMQMALVENGLGSPDLDAEQVSRIQQVMTDTGALARVEKHIADLAARAEQVLATLSVQPPGREVLQALIEAATARTA